jgi:hypothetical protein
MVLCSLEKLLPHLQAAGSVGSFVLATNQTPWYASRSRSWTELLTPYAAVQEHQCHNNQRADHDGNDGSFIVIRMGSERGFLRGSIHAEPLLEFLSQHYVYLYHIDCCINTQIIVGRSSCLSNPKVNPPFHPNVNEKRGRTLVGTNSAPILDTRICSPLPFLFLELTVSL